uniref:C2 domain-containing protein n=1 Tax=Haptolina brevifila TaxID=156173 RepID=A0A7S2IYT4_9EUKA
MALCRFVLLGEGLAMLERSDLDESDRSLLLEEAAARTNFQPRYLRVMLQGTADLPSAALPPMDANGSADAYVVLRLQHPALHGGDPYPKPGVISKTFYRSLRPQWGESLELSLEGGTLMTNGMFRSARIARDTSLKVELYDADTGLWGWLHRASTLTVSGCLMAHTAAYITGYSDTFTPSQRWWSTGLTSLLVGLLLVTTMMSVYLRAEDDLIGVGTVPLRPLLDQEEHTVLLAMQYEEQHRRVREAEQTSRGTMHRSSYSRRRRDQTIEGTRGVLKMVLAFSER